MPGCDVSNSRGVLPLLGRATLLSSTARSSRDEQAGSEALIHQSGSASTGGCTPVFARMGGPAPLSPNSTNRASEGRMVRIIPRKGDFLARRGQATRCAPRARLWSPRRLKLWWCRHRRPGNTWAAERRRDHCQRRPCQRLKNRILAINSSPAESNNRLLPPACGIESVYWFW
jgi:hypothetical protein